MIYHQPVQFIIKLNENNGTDSLAIIVFDFVKSEKKRVQSISINKDYMPKNSDKIEGVHFLPKQRYLCFARHIVHKKKSAQGIYGTIGSAKKKVRDHTENAISNWIMQNCRAHHSFI